MLQKKCVQVPDDPLRLFKLVMHPLVAIHIIIEKGAHLGDGVCHAAAQVQMAIILLQGGGHQVTDHGINAAGGIIADNRTQMGRQIGLFYHARPDGIVHVVVDIGHNVRHPHHLSLHGRRQFTCISRQNIPVSLGVFQNTVSHLPGQVQALTVIFQKINNPQALPIMLEAAGMELVKAEFSGMTKGGVTQIMAKGNRLGQVFI